MEQNKKYSEMTFQEFLTDILKIKLNEDQLHMVNMFEEVKINRSNYTPYFPPYTIKSPTVTYGSDSITTRGDSITTVTNDIDKALRSKLELTPSNR